ncbi:hypothetical protein [Cylindrospermopsis raciborskii]|nr:hypothetical protein [Cylindrospermopsis raciborskii]PNK05639.1 hypothetical protein CEP12_10800 [Cylindrospermopsis raciborskii S14]PNK11098.1 hypothetical protein CEP09_17240 [Cylindrospermopsis raciborskii S06]PNK13151.1 hypothetical protein CEP08_15815 [Cylindrospermopsis raciborskii S05]
MSNETITIADIFALFKESERQREAEQKRLSQEIEREREARQQEYEKRQQEYEKRQQEYEARQQREREERQRENEARQREYEERQREYEERQRKHEEEMNQFRISMEETRKIVAETNKNMGSITSRWGEFVENLVRPAAVRLFKEQGINVHYTSLQVKADDYAGSIEIDIWAENDGEIVAIEVKSHLKVRDIKRFITVLDRFKDVFPKYKNYKLYGAVAGIKVDEKADQYALEQGLFLIRPAGDSVAIDMKKDFQAKVW